MGSKKRENFLRNTLAITSAVLLLFSMTVYIYYGYHSMIFWIWLAAVVIGAGYFYLFKKNKQNESVCGFDGCDFIIAAIITVVVAVGYFSIDVSHPQHTLVDEIHASIETLLVSKPHYDVFQPTDLFYRPAPPFSIAGHFLQLFNQPIDLYSVRMAHIMLTLLVVFCAYFLFRRVFSEKFLAVIATLLLAGAHSLFAFGHLSIMTNTSILMQVLAMLFLTMSVQRNSFFHAFIAGFFSGLGWAMYSPAKIVIFCLLVPLITIAVLQSLKVLEKTRLNLKRIISIVLLGFFFGICPFVVGALTVPAEGTRSPDAYFTAQILLFPEAREHQHRLLNEHVQWHCRYRDLKDCSELTRWGAIRKNVINGLITFNSVGKVNGTNYVTTLYNSFTPFVDLLTGIFLWIGVLFALLAIRRGKIEMAIILTNFVFLYLFFSLFVARAPDVSRLMITLPFVIPLAVFGISCGVKRLCLLAPWRQECNGISKICIGIIALVIIFLNMNLLSQYFTKEKHEDWPVTAVAHYIHNQIDRSPEYFYVADSETAEYRREVWDTEDWQEVWMNFFIGTREPVQIEDVNFGEYVSHVLGRKCRINKSHGVSITRQRDPGASTIYHIVERIRRGPHHFYLITHDIDLAAHPSEFSSVCTWEIFLKLFSIFKQPLRVVEPTEFLNEEYNLPATFFITDDLWSTMDIKRDGGQTITAGYLSEKKNMLVVEILPN